MDHPPKVLQLSDASLAAYQRSRLRPNSSSFLAFYSSHLDGITRDPVLMTVPMDDHMCHRGHAVFDTCNVVDGHAYGLGFHLDRLIKSAGLARIPLQEWDKARLRETVLHTIAAAGRPNDVFVRFWLSVGAGDFSISPKATYGTAFFVMIQQAPPQLSTSTASGKAKMKLDGVREFCVDVPLKPALLANLKSTNYLLNALAAMQSEEKGGYLGIQLDAAGRVAEGAIGNVAIIDQGRTEGLRVPPDHPCGRLRCERGDRFQSHLLRKR
ncbi:aminotransferase [Baffinella frigidus]|nr:aminotransferase [Cryptophyta sp. CCMP2293]